MAIVYFDSSAAVKLVVEEDGSDLAAELWDAADTVVSSRIAYPEVCAALAAASRSGRLDEVVADDAAEGWELLWSGVRAVELLPRIAETAGLLAWRLGLRGADAVHVASALALEDDDTVVVAWDQRLKRGAAEAGLRVAPADRAVTVLS